MAFGSWAGYYHRFPDPLNGSPKLCYNVRRKSSTRYRVNYSLGSWTRAALRINTDAIDWT